MWSCKHSVFAMNICVVTHLSRLSRDPFMTHLWLILGPSCLILGRPRMSHDANESHVVVTHSGTVVTHSGASQNESRREWVTRIRDSLTHSVASQNESRWEWVTMRMSHTSSWLIRRDLFWGVKICVVTRSHCDALEWVTNESRMSHESVTTNVSRHKFS